MAANKRDVQLDIVGEDKTRAATTSASNNLDRLAKQSKTKSEEMTSKWKTASKQIAAAIGGAFIVEKSYDFVKDAISDANDYRRVNNLTAAAIKSTGGSANVTKGQVDELSDSLSRQDGVTRSAAQSVANMVLRFRNIKDTKIAKTFDETTKSVLDMAAGSHKAGTTVATQLGRALDDPIKNLGALSRLGVTFTKSQTKSIDDLWKAGKKQAAQQIILTAVQKKYGGAAAASATPLDHFKVSVNELQLIIGNYLLPKLDTAAKDGTKAFEWAQENQGTVKVLATVIGGLAAAMLVYKGAVTAVTAAQKIAAGVSTLFASAEEEVDAAMVANPIGLVVVAIAALAAGLIFAYKKSSTFRAIVNAAFGAVGAAAKFMWNDVLKPTFKFIIDAFLDVAGSIVHGAADAFGWVPGLGGKLKAAAKAFDTFKNDVNDELNGIKNKQVYVTVSTKAKGSLGLAKATASGRVNMSAADGWAPNAADGVMRVGGPQQVSAGPVNVDARVFIDGRQIVAVTRSTVRDAQSRLTHRARTGRR